MAGLGPGELQSLFEPQQLEAELGFPLNVVGPGSDRFVGWIAGAQDGGGEAGKFGEDLAQAGTPGVVTVLVPPTVLEEEQAVFDVPMLAGAFQ